MPTPTVADVLASARQAVQNHAKAVAAAKAAATPKPEEKPSAQA